MLRANVVSAIFRREFKAYFSGVLGYVFITIFVAAGAFFNFIHEDAFFRSNLANLDPLSEFMPWLMLILVPAVTMNIWAEEKRQGTDALLLTLPAGDFDIVLGKYLAALGIFSVSLAFVLSNVVILFVLGNPDVGLILGAFFGYWLMGAAFVATGMLGSMLSSSATLAFILGALFNAALVGASEVFGFGVNIHFKVFSSGVLGAGGLIFFVGVILVGLYLNAVILGRRHWSGGRDGPVMWVHYLGRSLALIGAVVAVNTMVGRVDPRLRADISSEGLHSLHPSTVEALASLDQERPVVIEAFVSPEVPQAYVETRLTLLNVLEQFKIRGGNAVRLTVTETKPFTEDARRAQDNFGIAPQEVLDVSFEETQKKKVFLGVAFTCGGEQKTIPFLFHGLPVEYELTRTLRVVVSGGKRKIGVLETELSIVGSFDFITKRPKDEWAVVPELRQQFEVVEVKSLSEYPKDLDVLMVLAPSTLSPEGMKKLEDYVLSGKPALLFDDPHPDYNDPRMRGRHEEQPEKGDFNGLLNKIGLAYDHEHIVWDQYFPHPKLKKYLQSYDGVFVSVGSGGTQPFNPEHAVSSGLQEVLLIRPGHFMDVSPKGGELTVTPLLRSGPVGGTVGLNEIQPDFFGRPPAVRLVRSEGNYMLAAHCRGKVHTSTDKDNEATGKVNAVVVANIGMLNDMFFDFRRVPPEMPDFKDVKFDNVTFVLNCADELAGESAFIELRKRRQVHRTLRAIDEVRERYKRDLEKEEATAKSEAEKKLQEAQKRLDDAVAAIDKREGLDEKQKAEQKNQVRINEQTRLERAKKVIEDEKERSLVAAAETMESKLYTIKLWYKALSVIVPPIPALIIGFIVFIVRRVREHETVSEKRLL